MGRLALMGIFMSFCLSPKHAVVASSAFLPNLRCVKRIGKAVHNCLSGSYSSLTPTQRLGTTPVFFVADRSGTPYREQSQDFVFPKPRKSVTYFMDHEDAYAYLLGLTSGFSAQDKSRFRLMSTSLEKAMEPSWNQKQEASSRRTSIHTIKPSYRECKNAISRAVRNQWTGWAPSLWYLKKDPKIPVFTASDLKVLRENGELFTPYYFAYEDLIDDLQLVKAKAPRITPQILVLDFAEVMKLAESSQPKPMLQRFIDAGAQLTGHRIFRNRTSTICNATNRRVVPGFIPPRKQVGK